MIILDLCENPDILSVLRYVKIGLTIIRIAVPIILIVSLMLGYTRAVGGKDSDELSRANRAAVSKVIAAILVFFIPTFINILAGVASFSSDSYIKCLNDATEENISSGYRMLAEKRLDAALSTLTKGDLMLAKNTIKKVKDKTIRAELEKEASTIEGYINIREEIYKLVDNYSREGYTELLKKINGIANSDVKERLLEELKTAISNMGSSFSYDLDPTDPKYGKLKPIKNPITLSQILQENGSSVEKLNLQIETAVDSVGVGTRQAPVVAGLTLIETLADYGYYVTYKWGGKHYKLGVNGSWGKITSPISCNTYPGGEDVCRATQIYSGLDCSGFVNWALIQGFRDPDNSNHKRQYTKIQYNSDVNLRGQTTAICNIGDVLVSGGHIVMIAGLDDEKKKYIIIESGGGHGGVGLAYKSYSDGGYYCRKISYSN